MSLLKSWVTSANDPESGFPLNNLPYGVFSTGGAARCGVAIGEMILPVNGLGPAGIFAAGNWNAFMALGPKAWADFRAELFDVLKEGAEVRPLVAQADVTMHMPFAVAEYTDFYAGRQHAENMGEILRGTKGLPANWLHIPGAIVGTGSRMGQPVSVAEADEMIFGFVLLNDWSARDIQGWEYQPLGPFQGKAFATSISPWIVTKAALEAFRKPTPPRDVPLLPYLSEGQSGLYDIELEVHLGGERVGRTNATRLYYSAAQQLAHHSIGGCPMRVGDLLGSGTISGPTKAEFGSLMELSPMARPEVLLRMAMY